MKQKQLECQQSARGFTCELLRSIPDAAYGVAMVNNDHIATPLARTTPGGYFVARYPPPRLLNVYLQGRYAGDVAAGTPAHVAQAGADRVSRFCLLLEAAVWVQG